jgi:hypothetical protein
MNGARLQWRFSHATTVVRLRDSHVHRGAWADQSVPHSAADPFGINKTHYM